MHNAYYSCDLTMVFSRHVYLMFGLMFLFPDYSLGTFSILLLVRPGDLFALFYYIHVIYSCLPF